MSADIVRQLRNLKDKDLDQQIAEVWGIVRDTPADRAQLIAEYRKMLTDAVRRRPPTWRWAGPSSPRPASSATRSSASAARSARTSPAPTGANLDYLLENILDPSAVIPKEYAVTIIEAEERPGHHRHRQRETPIAPSRCDRQRDADRAAEDDRDRDGQRHVDDARRSAQAAQAKPRCGS